MMQKFATFVVRNRILFLALALLLCIPAAYGVANVAIEYDLLTYLPNSLNSIQGLNILNREFGFSSTANVVVRDCPEWQVQELKQCLEQVEGVSGVFWLSDISDYTIPKEYQQDMVDQFYRGDATILQVAFPTGSSSPETRKAVNEIKGVLTENQDIIGTMVTTLEVQEVSEKEKIPMLLVAVALVIGVLLITMPSVITPFLFLLTLGLSILYNMGLVYFMGGRMSYITSSVVAALQLGVTMDYCIFLLHRFEEETSRGLNLEDAMVKALSRTITAIISSSLTTVAGFIALGLMKVEIGADLGFTMARGVFISVITTIFVLPSLLIVCAPLIKKLRHRPLLPAFSRLGRMVSRFRIPIFILLIMIAIPAWYGQSNLEVSYDMERSFPQSLPSMQALSRFREKYDLADSANLITKGLEPWETLALDQQIRSIPGIRSTSSFFSLVGSGIPDIFVPSAVSDRFYSNDYYNMSITLQEKSNSPVSEAAYEEIRQSVIKPDQEMYLTGQAIIDYDMRQLCKKDLTFIDWISVLAVGLIIALAFRSLSIPVLLVFIIQVAIWINKSFAFYAGNNMYYFSVIALGTIQLGATVDYAILMTTRFQEERLNYPPRVAITRATNECASSIFTSALTLCAAMIGIGLMNSLTLVKELAMLLARGSIISMLAVSILLPAALLLLDPVFSITSLKWPSRKNPKA
ncbi:MAG TPA: hypothetical protein DDZ65_04870 [Firmicutes bacterium]|jgi:hypothetical protein|nr:hypothetical protein [Bacillota bacterium]